MANDNNKANQGNDNSGTAGTNDAYQRILDNRSNQLNPNHPEYKGAKNGE